MKMESEILEMMQQQQPSFTETVSIDSSDQNVQMLEFQLEAMKQKSCSSELKVQQDSVIQGMKIEAEIELKEPTFSENRFY